MSRPIRLLIVDDHPVVRSGLAGLLTTEPDIEVVGEAGSGAEAIDQVAMQAPDLVLMDLQLPQLDGIAATTAIRASHPDVRVLVLTTYDSDADITAAIEAGVAGYILKDAGRDEICGAIRSVAAGQSALSPSVATKVLTRIRSGGGRELSGREIEALTAVANGLSNKQIARALHISEATVKTHLLHIYAKLGVDDRTAAVAHALEQGIIRLG